MKGLTKLSLASVILTNGRVRERPWRVRLALGVAETIDASRVRRVA